VCQPLESKAPLYFRPTAQNALPAFRELYVPDPSGANSLNGLASASSGEAVKIPDRLSTAGNFHTTIFRRITMSPSRKNRLYVGALHNIILSALLHLCQARQQPLRQRIVRKLLRQTHQNKANASKIIQKL
jgi:hypothetical protein